MADEERQGITAKKGENFSEWYTQVLLRSGFIDQGEVSGTMIFRPAAYAVWQQVMETVDAEFKKSGIEDVYFPLLIPQRFLEKEKEHVKGFTQEVAWVTEVGTTKLEEKLAIRPTSETIMYPNFSKWIRSWRDLPLRYNQWNNVLRWEFKHPTPFIRSREFLWNEGHSAFATEKDAMAEREVVLGIYKKVMKNYFALPGIPGKKTDKEKFAGAVASYSIELIMPDGWAIQGPDWHFDGQNFAKAFDIKYLDKEGNSQYVWQNTFALTTRMIGIMVATHSDDKGLVLPPKLAYVQVAIVPIYKTENAAVVKEFATDVASKLKKYRIKVDDRDGYSPGYKFNEWEMKGVPIRLEIGGREVESKKVVLVRRDTGEKTQVDIKDLKNEIEKTFKSIHQNLYDKAGAFLGNSVHSVATYDELKAMLKEKGGIVSAPWCENTNCEDKVKEETSAKITNIPFKGGKAKGKCIYCGEKAKFMANFARSY